ncbi:MAG TPA: hypothetical protein VIJ39_05900 [Solirubrobacteraceae bacterium]
MERSLGLTTGRLLLVLACLMGLVAAVIGLSAQAAGARSRGAAQEARTVSLSETAHMEASNEEIDGAEISERGRATGTYNVPITAGLTMHPKYVAAIVNIFLKGGTITAIASANFTSSGSTISFHGTLKISHGTGTYRHAAGELQIRGAFNHLTLKAWAVTSGSSTY